MGGNIYRALKRNDNLQPIADLIGAIRKKALQEEDRNAVYNKVGQFQKDVQGAYGNATIPGQPAQTFNVPYLLANPNLQGTSVAKPSPYGMQSPEPPKQDIIGDLIRGSIPGATQNATSSNVTPPNPEFIRTSTPATTPRYDIDKHEQDLTNLNVGLIKDMAGLEYLTPEDKQNAMNIISMLNQTNAPRRPQVTTIGENSRMVSFDPRDPSRGVQTILDSQPESMTPYQKAQLNLSQQKFDNMTPYQIETNKDRDRKYALEAEKFNATKDKIPEADKDIGDVGTLQENYNNLVKMKEDYNNGILTPTGKVDRDGKSIYYTPQQLEQAKNNIFAKIKGKTEGLASKIGAKVPGFKGKLNTAFTEIGNDPDKIDGTINKLFANQDATIQDYAKTILRARVFGKGNNPGQVTAPKSEFIEGKTYIDANDNKAIYKNGQWESVK